MREERAVSGGRWESKRGEIKIFARYIECIQSTLAITDDQNLVLFVRYSKGSGIRNII